MLHYQGLAHLLLVCWFPWPCGLIFLLFVLFILFFNVIIFILTLQMQLLLCNLNYNAHVPFSLPLGNCPQSRQSCRNHFRRRQKWTSVSQWKTRSCCGSYRTETWAVHARSLPLPPPWLFSPLATQAFSPVPPFPPDNTGHQLPGSSFSNTLPGTEFLSTLKAILAMWVLSPEGH